MDKVNKDLRKRNSIKLPAPSSVKLNTVAQDQKEIINLNVRGTSFATCKRTLTSKPNLLAKLFLNNSPLSPSTEPIFLDREPEVFRQFLFFLRTGTLLSIAKNELISLLTEAKYFDCESLVGEVEMRLRREIGMSE